MELKKVLGGFAVALSLAVGSQTAVSAPVLDGGWVSDSISAADTDSAMSPYVLGLSGYAAFRISDCCIVGDQYKVYDFGTLILTTAIGTPAVRTAFADGNPSADSAWTSGIYQTGEVWLSAGAHSLTVQGDGVGGLPAGFYVRLDSIPEPATLGLLGLALFGLGFARRRAA